MVIVLSMAARSSRYSPRGGRSNNGAAAVDSTRQGKPADNRIPANAAWLSAES